MERPITIVLAATLVGCSVTFPAVGTETLLRCTVRDAVTLDHNGTLSRDDNASKAAKTDIYIVDITTGALRLCSGYACIERTWIVAYRGGDANDTVLVAQDMLRYATTDFIRIRQWKGQKETLFLGYSLSTLASGTCTAVK
jgi:hypothetical protein